MCTMIADKLPLEGSAKGPRGWFQVDTAYVAYDHPEHAALDHAVGIDVVNESAGTSRIAIELSRDHARALALRILEVVDAADRYESQ